MNLPDKYNWLEHEPAPKMLLESIALYGVTEVPGSADNPVIMEWAKEVGVSGWFPNDATPWCGLDMGVCAYRAGWPINKQLLSALSWAEWGNHVPTGDEMLGDVLVFKRTGGGHVGQYIGESKTKFLVLGGNQSDMHGFTWIDKSRLFAARRAPWRVAQPTNVRKVYLDDSGVVVSRNEA